MNTMRYKGFIGSVAYSENDNVFFGRIHGINALVNFEGESVTELRNAFHEAVDDYIAYCEEQGIPARKSYTGMLNVRISPETHSRIAAMAGMAGISINSFIRQTLDNRVAEMNGNMAVNPQG